MANGPTECSVAIRVSGPSCNTAETVRFAMRFSFPVCRHPGGARRMANTHPKGWGARLRSPSRRGGRASITRLSDPFPGLRTRTGRGQLRSPPGATNERAEKTLAKEKKKSRMRSSVAAETESVSVPCEPSQSKMATSTSRRRSLLTTSSSSPSTETTPPGYQCTWPTYRQAFPHYSPAWSRC